MARAAVRGAHLNVRINAAGISDPSEYLSRAQELEAAAADREAAVLARVAERL
jgi:formiminotetrahydrofolate cyclodeaminase